VLIVPVTWANDPCGNARLPPEGPLQLCLSLRNQANIPDTISAIPHIYDLMTRDAELAHSQNIPVSDTSETRTVKTESA
jgi:hypothetical protein